MSLFRRLLGDTKEILGGGSAQVSSRNISEWQAFEMAIANLGKSNDVIIWEFDGYEQKRNYYSTFSIAGKYRSVNIEKSLERTDILNIIFRTEHAYSCSTSNYSEKRQISSTPAELFYQELMKDSRYKDIDRNKTPGLIERTLTEQWDLEYGPPSFTFVGDRSDPIAIHKELGRIREKLLNFEGHLYYELLTDPDINLIKSLEKQLNS